LEGCSETEIIKFEKVGCLQALFGLGAASGPRDFKSRVSTYSTTAACPPIAGDIKLHNKCQHINTAYGSIFSANRQVLQLVEIQREGLQAVV
jgi:hypothetical protein